MDASFGLESALWFADGPDDAHEDPTFRRSRSHDYVAAEIDAVRNAVGAIEVANFAKHRFSGPGARAFLDYILAGTIPKPGRITLTPMLTKKGKLYGDLTVACLDEETFMLFGSGAAQEMHRRWFERHLEDWSDDSAIRYENVSGQFHGIALSGPKSRTLLQRICRDDVSEDGIKFRDVRQTFVAGVPAILVRISFSGEFGCEIYVRPEYQLKLFEEIEVAGNDLDLKWYGVRALMSMRLEKSWGAWTLDYRPDFTPAESGLDVFINWNKTFIGKDAAVVEKQEGPSKRLVTMTVDTIDIDVCNDEAILKDGECVGYVTSGGYAHRVAKSMAMGYLPVALANDEMALDIEINGELFAAKVCMVPLYDPSGSKAKS